MARYENDGYCPCMDVAQTLQNTKVDKRLYGIWWLIGDRIVCDKSVNSCEVVKLFTVDPIAAESMKALIQRLPQKIVVHQQQQTTTITECCKKLDNPEIIVAKGSKFVALVSNKTISKNNVCHFYFWKLV